MPRRPNPPKPPQRCPPRVIVERRVIIEPIVLLLAGKFSRDREEVDAIDPGGATCGEIRAMRRAAQVLASLAMISTDIRRGGCRGALREATRRHARSGRLQFLHARCRDRSRHLSRKYDLDIERIDLEGGAKLHQAMAAGAIDIALGGGTDLLFVAKGLAGESGRRARHQPGQSFDPRARRDLPIKAITDLKGKKIAATTVGSLTSWFAQEIARHEGLGCRRRHAGLSPAAPRA